MLQSSSDRARGHTSLLVTAMIAMLMSLLLGHVRHVHLLTLRGRAFIPSMEKARVLANALQEIRISGRRDLTATTIGNERCRYSWRFDSGDNVVIDRIEVELRDRPGWPRPIGLWIRYRDMNLMINDFQTD